MREGAACAAKRARLDQIGSEAAAQIELIKCQYLASAPDEDALRMARLRAAFVMAPTPLMPGAATRPPPRAAPRTDPAWRAVLTDAQSKLIWAADTWTLAQQQVAVSGKPKLDELKRLRDAVGARYAFVLELANAVRDLEVDGPSREGTALAEALEAAQRATAPYSFGAAQRQRKGHQYDALRSAKPAVDALICRIELLLEAGTEAPR